jgi:hypothetical protein
MTKEKLKIEFGQPEHGWLPVDMRHGDFELNFEASDVPINPIDQLISGIRQITKGISTEVWWHLEPAGYYFDFDIKGDEYNLRISFAKNDRADKELVYETQGKFEDIIMPFYRSIKSFFTQTIEEPHWPKTDEREIKALTNIVKGS